MAGLALSLALVAIRLRLGGEPVLARLADDPAWLPHADAILHGGRVPVELARTAAERVAAGIAEPASVAVGNGLNVTVALPELTP